MMDLVKQVGPELGIVAACAALGLARSTPEQRWLTARLALLV